MLVKSNLTEKNNKKCFSNILIPPSGFTIAILTFPHFEYFKACQITNRSSKIFKNARKYLYGPTQCSQCDAMYKAENNPRFFSF